MERRFKYPRTPHLPWSEGATSDDKIMKSVALFEGQEVVVTEKMDGENSTIYRDGTHARSTTSGHHQSRSWLKALQGRIGHEIPSGTRLCGENVYAKHSIAYHDLPGYFLLFSVWEGPVCLSWDDTAELAALLDLPTVPVLYRGPWNETKVRECYSGKSTYGDVAEGYVVRTVDQFEGCFPVAKFVRANHVQTDTHWMHASVVPNCLRQEG